jgi:D-threo-aldose 1-dehydrogenase
MARIGLGVAALGNPGTPPDERIVRDVLEQAWTAGVRSFDAAHLYGGGLAEQRLGAFLRGTDGTAIVSTKIGRYRAYGAAPPAFTGTADTHDYSADATARAVDLSLRRMGVPRLDLVYVHDAQLHEPEALESAFPILRHLQEQGVIGAIGAGSDSVPHLLTLVEAGVVDAVMIAGRCTPLDVTAVGALLPACLKRNVAVVAASVFQSGILATGARPGAQSHYREADPATLAAGRALERLCDIHGVSLRAAALRFPLRHPAIGAIMLGAGLPEQLADNFISLSAPIPEAFWHALASWHEQDAPR